MNECGEAMRIDKVEDGSRTRRLATLIKGGPEVARPHTKNSQA